MPVGKFPKAEARQRRRRAAKLLRARRGDRRGSWIRDRDILAYGRTLKVKNFRLVIEQMIKERGRPISALDAGMGKGLALSQLKAWFGGNVRTVGIAVSRVPDFAHGVDRRTTGDFTGERTRKRIGEQFDLIVSAWGGTYYSDCMESARGVVELLKPGGKAVVQLNLGLFWRKGRRVVNFLRQNGCTVEYARAAPFEPAVLHITKKPAQQLSLPMANV